MDANLPSTLIPLTHVQEERQLRDEVTKAFHAVEADDEDDGDDFLVKKEDGALRVVDDDEAQKYRQFLLEQAGGEDGVREILGLKTFAKRDIVADEEEDEAAPAESVVTAAASSGKKVRTKDDDEEFLMK